MSTYQTLALRHRPKKLDDMVGQDTPVKIVKGFLKAGKVPQTILISGPYANGKTSLSRMIAKYINCLNPTPVKDNHFGEPCGRCWSCLELEKVDHNHPDVIEVNAAETRGIDAVRGWIDQSKYKPQSNYKVFILDEFHAITGEAAQAFLKPLEEPSKSTVWILCTTELSRIIHPIRSRAMPIKLQDISPEDCASLLTTVLAKEGVSLPEGKKSVLRIAEAARGHPREALQILEAVINVVSTLDVKTIDLNSVVEEVSKDVIGETPDSLVQTYLLDIYLGKFTTPLKILSAINNPILFLDTLMKYNALAVKYLCDNQDLLDKYYGDFYKKLEDRGILSGKRSENYKETLNTKHFVFMPWDLALATDTIFEAIAQLKQYSVDPYFILFRLTVKIATQFKSLMVDKKSPKV